MSFHKEKLSGQLYGGRETKGQKTASKPEKSGFKKKNAKNEKKCLTNHGACSILSKSQRERPTKSPQVADLQERKKAKILEKSS